MKKFIPLFLSTVMFFSSGVYAEEFNPDFWAYEQILTARSDGWLDENAEPNAPASFETINAAFTYLFNNDEAYNFETITRGQLAELLSEYLYYDGNDTVEVTFPDAVSSQFSSSIQQCCDSGVLNGYSDGTFKPDKLVTNAELAVITNNLKKNIDEAFDAYLTFNEKYKNLKSFTMDFNIDMDMFFKSFEKEDNNDSNQIVILPRDNNNFKSVSSGTIKTYVNDLEKFDLEMSGNMKTSVLGIEQNSNIYFKDNTYYMDSNDMKVKMPINYNDVISQLGLLSNEDFEKNAFLSGFVKKFDDGSKDVYAVFNMQDIMSNFSANLLPDMDFTIGKISMVIHIDKDDNLLGYNMYSDMHIEAKDQLLDVNYNMNADYKIRDLNNTSVDIPDNLDEYQPIDTFVFSSQEGDLDN